MSNNNFEISEKKALLNAEAVSAATRKDDCIKYSTTKPLILNDDEKIIEIRIKRDWYEEEPTLEQELNKQDKEDAERKKAEEDLYDYFTDEEVEEIKESEKDFENSLEKYAEEAIQLELEKEAFEEKLMYNCYKNNCMRDEENDERCFDCEDDGMREFVIVFQDKENNKDATPYEVTLTLTKDITLEDVQERLLECNGEIDFEDAFEIY